MGDTVSSVLPSILPAGVASGKAALWEGENDSLLRFILVMASVAAGFFLVLKVGFVLHHDPQPAWIASRVFTITACLFFFAGVALLAHLAIQAGIQAATKARIRKDAKRADALHAEARRRRIRELAADPARARYAPLVARGEDWSDDNIAYCENPNQTATCSHLQPIERAMRRAGIETRRNRETDISATCRIDWETLRRAFDFPPVVRCAEFFAGERFEHEHPTAFLICDEHNSIIHTVHPEAAGANDAPWFPTSPGDAANRNE